MKGMITAFILWIFIVMFVNAGIETYRDCHTPPPDWVPQSAKDDFKHGVCVGVENNPRYNDLKAPTDGALIIGALIIVLIGVNTSKDFTNGNA